MRDLHITIMEEEDEEQVSTPGSGSRSDLGGDVLLPLLAHSLVVECPLPAYWYYDLGPPGVGPS